MRTSMDSVGFGAHKTTETKQMELETLEKRERAIRAKIAAVKQKQQLTRERDHSRLVNTIGAVLLEQAARVPTVDAGLRQVLGAAELDGRTREFLSSRGWL